MKFKAGDLVTVVKKYHDNCARGALSMPVNDIIGLVIGVDLSFYGRPSYGCDKQGVHDRYDRVQVMWPESVITREPALRFEKALI